MYQLIRSVIKFVKQEDIFNLAITSKLLYKAVLLHYPFDNDKLLSKLSDSDFNLALKNINIYPEIIFRAIILGNKHQLLKTYLNKIDPSINDNTAIRWASHNGHYKIVKILLENYNVNVNYYLNGL